MAKHFVTRDRRYPRLRRAMPAALTAVAATAALAACSSATSSTTPIATSSGSSAPAAAAASASVTTAKIGGVTVLTNSKGFALYSFAPDTATKSNCNGSCATYWPPVPGPVTASGISGTFGTIKRADGSTQATFGGHPLYTYVGDTKPGQATGNGLDTSGGLWHEVTPSGQAAPAGTASPSSGNGY